MTRVLAIDPGIKRVGWAVVQADADEVLHIASGCWDAEDLSVGLLLEVIHDHHPERAAVERPVGRVFGGLKSLVDTAVIAGRVWGWLDHALAGETRAYAASTWRGWVTGCPSAKDAVIAAALLEQVQRLPKRSNPDQRDAIGLALFAARQWYPQRRVA